jgi:hypothetical protein
MLHPDDAEAPRATTAVYVVPVDTTGLPDFLQGLVQVCEPPPTPPEPTLEEELRQEYAAAPVLAPALADLTVLQPTPVADAAGPGWAFESTYELGMGHGPVGGANWTFMGSSDPWGSNASPMDM